MANVGSIEVQLRATGAGQFIADVQHAASTVSAFGGQAAVASTQTQMMTHSVHDASGSIASLSSNVGQASTLLAQTTTDAEALSKTAYAGMNNASGAAGNAAKKTGELADALKAAAGAGAAWAMVTSGFDLASQASANETAIKTFRALGGSMKDLRSATGSMISDAELAKKANLAETMGIDGESFKMLAQIAQASAAKTGQSMGYLFDSIVTGTARQSKMILDNLGLMINQERAERALASQKGKSVQALSEQEKKQAFMNEIMSQGSGIMKQLQDAGLSIVSPFAQFTATMENAKDAIGLLIKDGFVVMFDWLSPITSNVIALTEYVERLSPPFKKALGVVLALVGGFIAFTAGTAGLATALGLIGTAVSAGIGLIGALAGPITLVIAVIGGVVAGVAFLHKAWRENWGGMQQVVASIIPTITDYAKTMAVNVLAAIYYMKDGGIWAFSQLAQLGISVLLAAVVGAVDLMMSAFAGMLSLGGKAFKALGMKNEAKMFEDSAASLKNVTSSIGDAIDNVQGELAFKVRVEAPDFSAAKTAAGTDLQQLGKIVSDKAGALAQGAKDTLSSLYEGGKSLGGQFLDVVHSEWADIFKSIGLFTDEDERRIKQGGKDVGESITEAMRKAREKFADLIAELRGKASLIGTTGPLRDMREATLETAKQMRDASKLAAEAGVSEKEAMSLIRANNADRLAQSVNSVRSLDEFNQAINDASMEALKTKTNFADVAAGIQYRPTDLKDVVSGPIGAVFDQIAFASGAAVQRGDRGQIVEAISAGLADMMRGGKIDLTRVGEVIGTLIGSQTAFVAKQLVGGAEIVGSAVGGISQTLGGMVSSLAGISKVFGVLAGSLGAVGGVIGSAVSQAAQVVIPMIKEAVQSVIETIRTVFDEIPKAISGAANKFASLIPEDRIQAAIATAFNPTIIQAFFVPAVIVVATSLFNLAAFLDMTVGMVGRAAMVLGPAGIALAGAFATVITVITGPMIAFAAAVTVATVGLLGAGFVLTGFIAAFLKLSTETQSFKAFGESFKTSVSKIVTTLEPFWVHMSALAGLFDAFVDVVVPLASSFAASDVAARLLFYSLKGAAIALAGGVFGVGLFVAALSKSVEAIAVAMGATIRAFESFIQGLNQTNTAMKTSAGTMLSAFLSAFGSFMSEDMRNALTTMVNNLNPVGQRRQDPYTTGLAGAFDDLANQARAMTPDLDAMAQAIRDLTGLSYEEALARAKAIQTQKDVTESLTNVPSGYKVALARFEAMDATGAGGGAGDVLAGAIGRIGGAATGAGSSGWGAGGPTQVDETAGWSTWQPPNVLGKASSGQPGQNTTIVMENVTVVANNPQELMQSLEATAKRSAFIRTGSSNDRTFRPFNGAGI